MLRCQAFSARFSQREGTPLFDSRLPPEWFESGLEHNAEGWGVRLSRIAGEHSRDLHDELVEISPLTREAQFDEKWSFVAKKEKNCDETDPADDRKGDTWDHVAIDAENRLVISVAAGERAAENVVAVVNDFKRRTGGRLMDRLLTRSRRRA